VKRIGKRFGKAITVYEDDTLNSLMSRIKEVFSQNDFKMLLTKKLGEITDINQVFCICRMKRGSAVLRVATSSELTND
jgi:hypothetical protein